MTYAYLILSLCSSFPPNPSVPRSCPSVQVSAASDLPVHHEVAFVQLWPHLLGSATLTQPFRRQDGPLLRSPVATLAYDTSPFDLNLPALTLTQPKLRSQQVRYGSEFEAALDAGRSLNLGQIPPPWKTNKERPEDLGLLKGLVQFRLCWTSVDQQTTSTLDPLPLTPVTPDNGFTPLFSL